MNKIIEQKYTLASQFSEAASKYVESIEQLKIISSMNIVDVKIFNEAISQLKDEIGEKRIIDLKEPLGALLPSMSALYEFYEHVIIAMNKIIDIIGNQTYYKMYSTQVSQTLLAELDKARRRAMEIRETFHDAFITDSYTYMESIGDVLNLRNSAGNLDTVLKFILVDNHDHVNKFIIELIRLVIPLSAKMRGRLIDIIESDKEKLFNSRRIKSALHAPQYPLLSFGLIPATGTAPIADIIKLIAEDLRDLKDSEATPAESDARSKSILYRRKTGGIQMAKTAKTPESLWRSLGHQYPQVCFVLINKTSRSCIEFDIRGIISANYIMKHDLKVSPTSGLTKKIIEKYNTVKYLKYNPINGALPNITIVNPEARICYVLDTLNGADFRILAHGSRLSCTKDSIRGMFDGIRTFPVDYNQHHSCKILEECFDLNAEEIMQGYDYRKLESTVLEATKNFISADLATRAGVRIDEHIPINREQFVDILDADDVSEIIIARLLQATGEYVTIKGSPEKMLNYCIKFNELTHEFMKEYMRLAQRLAPRIFEGIDANTCKSAFVDICQGCMKELDRAGAWEGFDVSIKDYFLIKKLQY